MPTDWNAVSNELAESVRDRDLVTDLLADLDCERVTTSQNGREYRMPCPIHQGDNRSGLSLRTDGDDVPVLWTCWTNHCEQKFKRSLLGFVRGVLSAKKGRDVEVKAAADYLREFVARQPTSAPARPRPARPSPTPALLHLTGEQVRGRLIIPSSYFRSRGFSAGVLDRHDVGHSRKRGTSVVPVYDDVGDWCIGFTERIEQENVKPKWYTHFRKSDYLYNYHVVRTHESGVVLVVEGPGDVWRVEEAGYDAVALLGNELSPVQTDKLLALGRPIVLALDNDPAGREGAARILARHRFPELYIPPPMNDLAEVPAKLAAKWIAEVAS